MSLEYPTHYVQVELNSRHRLQLSTGCHRATIAMMNRPPPREHGGSGRGGPEAGDLARGMNPPPTGPT
ncbi:hypothetical protein BJV78DRAFT_1231372 [Lactifluus subvellereus]|nr:hypothetical protein BJV78DRAFT_1231372 [Lactifluus subvellereus]